MKKLISYTTILLLFFTVFSCKDMLNIQPENIIQGSDVFANESAIEAYMATLYNEIPLQDHNLDVTGGGLTFMCHLSDEALNNAYRWRNSIGDGTWLQWWGYHAVRDVNDFIANIEKSDFPDFQKNEWLGEARFIRAYYYFEMVKRYGGVPLITEVQDFNGENLGSLLVSRNTEKEVYDFVGSELDEAGQLLSESKKAGRANKYAAFALKSRAMLYAASEAKYGSLTLNGLVGIPAADADVYWQEAYDAAKSIIDSKAYSLYNKQVDKTQNYENLFLDQDNPEVIFARYFHYPEKTHLYDFLHMPYSMDNFGGHVAPTLELAEAYEYTDGSDGKLKLTDAGGNPIEYENPVDLFKDKDPRFAATILYPFSTWEGHVLDVRAGIIDGGQTLTSGNYNTLYKGMHIIGQDGIGGTLGNSPTGFYICKYLNPNYTPTDAASRKGSDQQYIDLRYGEILLNYAEAAIELNKVGDAKTAVNEIRDRAGIKQLNDSEMTRDRIRHERQVELAFESQRYWDIRRWRIADDMINNTKFSGIYPYYRMEDKAYIFTKVEVGYALTFDPKLYYEKIPAGEISKDPNLLQNPNY